MINSGQNYPKTKKYISLFPPEIRKDTLPPTPSEAAKTDEGRQEVRIWIREKMANGELSSEPEMQLGPKEGGKPGKARGAKGKLEWDAGNTERANRVSRAADLGQKSQRQEDDEDEFFGEDDEDVDQDSVEGDTDDEDTDDED